MNKKELICYCTDASRLFGKVDKVFFPKNSQEVQEVIKIINSDIVPRGAGSGFVGGAVPNNSVVIDMTKMNKILGFNALRRVVGVEAGITLKELNEKLIARGFEFPIDILNKGISTIGGMIATNASGKRAMRYGTMRDWIDEVEFVNGKGELTKIGKADLADVSGMEGITGIIVSAKIRVIPRIKRSASIFQTDNLDEVLSVARKLRQEKEVVSIELFSKQTSGMLGFPEKYNLIVEFDSQRGKMIGEEYEKLDKINDNLYYSLGLNEYYNSEDPKFFFDKIKEFLVFLELTNVPYFSFLGNGIIHAFFKDEEKEKRKEVLEVMKKMQAKLGKYGYGLTRKDFLEQFEAKIIQRIKSRHDPLGKFNKGKVVDGVFQIKRAERTEANKSFVDYEKTNSKLKIDEVANFVFSSSPNPKQIPHFDKEHKYEGFVDELKKAKPSVGEEKTASETIYEIEETNVEISEPCKGFEYELGEIKPSIGEEKTASETICEIKEKTPEEKLREFIEEVSKKEKIEKIIEPVQKTEEKLEIKEPVRNKEDIDDYNRIRSIMTNRYRYDSIQSSSTPVKPEEKKSDVSDYGKTDSDINQSSVFPNSPSPKKRLSDYERDLIKRIVGNNFKEKKNGEKNDEVKKEEKNNGY